VAQLQELGFKVTLEAAAAATARISENVPPSKLGLTPSGLGLPVVAQRLSPRGDISPQVDARVLAERCRRDPGPTVWVPSLSDRELRERLNRRAHLIRLRTATRNRVFGALTQWGVAYTRADVAHRDPMVLLKQRGLPRPVARATHTRQSQNKMLVSHPCS